MSEEGKSHTSVLLPGASVALFTTDGETKDAFQELESDWRFARVSLETIEGGLETAIKTCAAGESPDLIIIQTEDIDDGFSDRLEELAGSLSENTSAIIIGPVNDVNLYRKLVGMGVSDYLVKPIKSDMLGDNIASTLIEQVGASDSRLIALMGAKGGVGSTVLTEALAWGVCDDLKQKTFLMDISGGWSTLSVGMNFEPSTTLAEAVRAAVGGNEDSLSRMIYQADEKLFVLSTGGDVMLDDAAEQEKFEVLLEYLMGIYPVVIIDLSGGTAALKRTVLTRAHLTYLVTTPTLPSVRAARTLLQEIKELRGGEVNDVEVILNMQNYAAKFEVPKAQIQEGLERPPSVSIPFDPSIFVSVESEAGKLGENKQGAQIVKDLLAPVRNILSISDASNPVVDEKKGGMERILTKLKVKS